ncbi:helix-turn-helix domain-containing protein [Streptacidiphilus anmyonensis]|uniref:helix-turn-helix domain-containing protein n=1 Tax=Streptacidiphilus anmyonensis TaxID=405782 RepID=UPI0005A76185|nr:helix-turn-helix transcriptional regulator [Streptacidiphilus anmyonensis]
MEQRIRRTPPAGLGPLLNRARLRAGYRLREAERLLAVSHPYLLRLESGERVPSRAVASRIAALFVLDDDERAKLFAAAVDDAGADHPLRRPA